MIQLNGCLSYERFEDKAVEVYDRQGNSLVFISKLGDSERDFATLKRSITRQLVAMAISTNAWAKVGIYSQDLPMVQLEEDQIKKIREACVFHGTLPTIRQRDLTKALGLSTQAITSRTKTGTLEAYGGPWGRLIPLDSLTPEDAARVKTYFQLQEEQIHA